MSILEVYKNCIIILSSTAEKEIYEKTKKKIGDFHDFLKK
jgi:hypothetical protein